MQSIDRSSEPPPHFLRDVQANKARLQLKEFFLADPVKRSQSYMPNLALDLNQNEVFSSLKKLFRGKCAFCETKSQMRPYRFRPASNAAPSRDAGNAHLYYAWLVNAWENIYPICKGCIPGNPDFFPVLGKRAPLPTEKHLSEYASDGLGRWRKYPPKESNQLLDPCVERSFLPHFQVDHRNGELLGLGPRARVTIEHFNLNRPELVEQRADLFNRYMSILLGRTLQQFRNSEIWASPSELDIFDFRDLTFGGLWYLQCRRIALAMTVGWTSRPKLSKSGIADTFRQIAQRPDLEQQLFDLDAQLVAQITRQKEREGKPLTFLPTYPALVSIELKYFKGIEQLRLNLPHDSKRDSASGEDNSQLEQPALLILGENAAGKSSILEAVALALCTNKARAELRLPVSELPLNPELMGCENIRKFTNASIKLGFDNGADRILTIEDGTYQQLDPQETPPVFAYGAFRQYQKGVRRFSSSSSIVTLFHSETLLSNPEKWLLSLKDAEFSMVVRALRDILSVEGEFDVMARDLHAKSCSIVTSTPGSLLKHKTPLKLASSGYRSVLAMACDIMQGLMNRRINPHFDSLLTAQAVVLIDEVEAHLHPRWKIQIMRALRKALPNVTFIATTHDPLCLRGMNDGEVVVMHRVASQNVLATQLPIWVEQLTHLPNVTQLTIDQLLTSDFFNLASTDQPKIERQLAEIADLLSRAKADGQLSDAERARLAVFETEINSVLPVGTTEAQRLVQEAVVEFLQKRREASAQQLVNLRVESRQRILNILESL